MCGTRGIVARLVLTHNISYTYIRYKMNCKIRYTLELYTQQYKSENEVGYGDDTVQKRTQEGPVRQD